MINLTLTEIQNRECIYIISDGTMKYLLLNSQQSYFKYLNLNDSQINKNKLNNLKNFLNKSFIFMDDVDLITDPVTSELNYPTNAELYSQQSYSDFIINFCIELINRILSNESIRESSLIYNH